MKTHFDAKSHITAMRALASPLDGATRQQRRAMQREFDKGLLTRHRDGSIRYA